MLRLLVDILPYSFLHSQFIHLLFSPPVSSLRSCLRQALITDSYVGPRNEIICYAVRCYWKLIQVLVFRAQGIYKRFQHIRLHVYHNRKSDCLCFEKLCFTLALFKHWYSWNSPDTCLRVRLIFCKKKDNESAPVKKGNWIHLHQRATGSFWRVRSSTCVLFTASE